MSVPYLTLGWAVLDWMINNLAAPDGQGRFMPTKEQAAFLLKFYEVTGDGKKRVHSRAVISRPRGWGKSPFLAAIAAAEALADVVPNGLDGHGEPTGRPWRLTKAPLVYVSATTKEQTANTWRPLLQMLSDGAVKKRYDLNIQETKIILPGRGIIEPVYSSRTSVKGAPTTFVVMDQTESWVPSNHGTDLAYVLRTNANKSGGYVIEAPNAFTPGEDSVAESSWNTFVKQEEGKIKRKVVYFDHREPIECDLDDEAKLINSIRYAYGDSMRHPDGCVLHDPPCKAGWVDPERVLDAFHDASNEIEESRRDYLNQVTKPSNGFIDRTVWRGLLNPDFRDDRNNPVTLGFDGSRKRKRGTTDATALVAYDIVQKTLSPVHVWEEPELFTGKEWEIPTGEVDETVKNFCANHNVVGFYADPAHWESYVAGWEAILWNKLKIKAAAAHPIEYWMNGGNSAKTSAMIARFASAVDNGTLKHDGSAVLTRHITNARTFTTQYGVKLMKESPDSSQKIDAAVAAVLAYNVGMLATAKGLARPKGRIIRIN